MNQARRARERDRVLDERITQPAAAQVVTEQKLQALIDSMNRSGNGRH